MRPEPNSFELTEQGIRFRDTRYKDEEEVLDFGELHARVHALITDRILAVDQSANVLSDVPKEQVLQCISDLESARLLYREENRILGLALPAACYDHQKARLKMLEETLVAG
ncbi:MAG: hypothetical protein WAK33_09210 [Silvibacterium sp.]